MIEHPPRRAAQLPSASTAIGDMIARSSASAQRVSTWATRSLVPSITAATTAHHEWSRKSTVADRAALISKEWR